MRRVGAGLSLVEVLVALAIVALALAAATQASSALVSGTERQSQALLGQLCAENELAKLRLSRLYPGAGDQSFSCDQGGQKLWGSLRVATTPNPNFRRVEALVRSEENETSPQVFRITTILARF
jgi:general secretion pathway protein I